MTDERELMARRIAVLFLTLWVSSMVPSLQCRGGEGGGRWLIGSCDVLASGGEAGCSEAGCHDRVGPSSVRDRPEEGIFLHGPLKDGECSPCHPSHAKGRPPTAVLHGALPEELYAPYTRATYAGCFGTCHSPELVEQATTATATGFRNGEDNLHYRHVAKLRRGRSCRLCHAPHDARNPRMIRDFMPFGTQRLTLSFLETKGGGTCTTSCHLPSEYNRRAAVPSRMRVVEQPEIALEVP